LVSGLTPFSLIFSILGLILFPINGIVKQPVIYHLDVAVEIRYLLFLALYTAFRLFGLLLRLLAGDGGVCRARRRSERAFGVRCLPGSGIEKRFSYSGFVERADGFPEGGGVYGALMGERCVYGREGGMGGLCRWGTGRCWFVGESMRCSVEFVDMSLAGRLSKVRADA
jgi:hypothetical protein